MDSDQKPVVLVTGAAGNVGTVLGGALGDGYALVGLEKAGETTDAMPVIPADLTNDVSTDEAMGRVREEHGSRIASVIHLAAYHDFTGEEHPLYEKLNVEGTRRLLRALRGFEVEQFLYPGTMLIHCAGRPGERIDENAPIAPGWAYPRSKARAEEAIRAEHGDMPIVLLHLAGLYDEKVVVPTVAHQIARIHQRDPKSRLYAGDLEAGQSMVHEEDMGDAFRRAVDRRATLPLEAVILIGEPDPPGYGELQDAIGRLIHGEEWATLRVPAPLAAAGAWVEEKAAELAPEPLGVKEPFERPFMMGLASDHYALDVSRARELLDWTPRHRFLDTLPAIVANLRADPAGWYKANHVEPPAGVAARA